MPRPITPASLHRAAPPAHYRAQLADAAPRAVAFHYIVLGGCTIVSWAVDGGRAQASTFEDAESTAAAIIDCYVGLRREYREPLRLYVAEGLVRQVLSDEVEVVSVVAGAAMKRTWDRARRLLDALGGDVKQAMLPPAPEHPDEIIVATDASMGRRSMAGIAYVTSTGKLGSTTIQAANIHDAEVSAILLALGRAPHWAKKITILSDSKVAVRALNDGELVRGIGKHVDACRGLMGKLAWAGVKVEVRWVRGHAGHELNEAADRVAVHARRCGEWNLGPAHAEFRRRMREELRVH